MTRSRACALLATGALALSGCAYVTAKPLASYPDAEGIPIYGIKSYLLVNAEGATLVTLPDCSQQYRLQIGSFLAKNHTMVELTHGVVTKVDSDQDTTAIVPELVSLAQTLFGAPALPAGDEEGDDGAAAAGGPAAAAASAFDFYEARCDANGTLTLTPADAATRASQGGGGGPS